MKKYVLIVLVFATFNPLGTLGQKVEIDKQIGAENAHTVETEMGIYANAKMNAYLDALGQKLVSNLENPLFQYQFKIVPDVSPNAFALPGGYIYITTGIIPLLETEDELACVLGHEIIHSNNRHTIRQAKKSILPKILEIPGNLLGVINKDIGRLVNAPIKATNSLIFASYSRKFETEADDEGVKLAAKTGYDPTQLPKVLTRMNTAIEALTGQKEEKSYFSDHPYTPDRNQNILKQAANVSVAKEAPVSSNFLMEFDKVQFGSSPATGVVDGNVFMHPDINFYIKFPQNWIIDNQPEAVAAYHPEGKAAGFVTLENPAMSASQAGKAFVKSLGDEYRSKIEFNDVYQVGNMKGYLVSFIEQSKHETVYAYLLWLPLNGKMFKLLGIAPLTFRNQLESSVKSLRTLTDKERASIKYNFVKVVKARQGETLSGLSKRTGNKLNLALTAIINDHKPADKLGKEEQIKIVLDKPYLSK